MSISTELCLRRRLLLAVGSAAAAKPARRVYGVGSVAVRGISVSAARLEASRWRQREGSGGINPALRASEGAKTWGPARMGHKERSLALFKSVVGGEEEGDGGVDESNVGQRITEVRFLMRSGQMTVEEAWRTVKEEILPVLGSGKGVNATLAAGLRGLLEPILEAKRERIGDRSLPSGKEIAEVYIDVGRATNLRPLLRLVKGTLEHITAHQSETSDTAHIVEDVAGLWLVIFSASQPARLSVLRIPALKSAKIQRLIRRPDPFAAVIQGLMAPAPAVQLVGMPAFLLATLTLIEREGLRSSDAAKPIAPLLNLLEDVMASVWVSPEEAMHEFQGQSEILRSYVEENMDILRERMKPILDPSQFHRHLSRAFKARDLDHIRQVWVELSGQIQKNSAVQIGSEEHKRYADLLNFCVFIWCALGQEDIDIVLTFMSQNGFDYTLRTYTSMIEGWKQARKPRNIGLLWAKLVKDGVPLDSVIWSARISALMACGLEKPAIKALYEMGQLWDEAVKHGRQDEAVKPDVGPVNAALTGVLRSKGVKAAPAVLSWAAKYDVEPDIVTYNMLLRAMLKDGLATEAAGLLSEMNSRRVGADAATFTIIVEEVLGAAAGSTEEQQLEAVNGIFAAIKASGQKPKIATYAKMIHVLLDPPRDKHESGGSKALPPPHDASAAVNAVLAHMERNNILPSSHIFTIIADYYFSHGEVEAVRDMIRAWGLETTPAEASSKVDSVFWEVVIRGYSRAGLAQEAKEAFFRLRRERRVALSVLDQLLVALLKEGDEEGARELVAAVRERKAGVEGAEGAEGEGEGEGERERYMKHHFWHVVAEHGLG